MRVRACARVRVCVCAHVCESRVQVLEITSSFADVVSPWIVLEYMENGDLKSFLTVSRVASMIIPNSHNMHNTF